MAVRPQLPVNALGAAERFAVVSSIPSDLAMVTTYGSLPRSIVCLGSARGNVVLVQSSPYDDTGSNDEQTVPMWPGLSLPLAASKIKATTDASTLPLLLCF